MVARPGAKSPRKPSRPPAVPGWKRPFDLTVALFSLPVWLPLMGLCALWIRCVSRGEVFFRQERIGYGGQPFTLFKFRTMRKGADTAVHATHLCQLMRCGRPMTKLDHEDDRLIAGARLLRALGLDELPQILNVVLGQMSMVGPRPCTLGELEHYRPFCYKRFDGLPGITGSWQVNGKNKTTFRRMVALDVLYLRNASAGMDLLILLRTGPAVLGQVLDLGKKRISAAGQSHAGEPLPPEGRLS